MSDSKQSVVGTVALLKTASLLLAIVSMLLLILSIYSGISMDVVNRQKEVAIRKINGATPKVIALLFGKIYLIIYLSVFVIIYPLVRLVLIGIGVLTHRLFFYISKWTQVFPLNLFVRKSGMRRWQRVKYAVPD